jgi:hypothetical protein
MTNSSVERIDTYIGVKAFCETAKGEEAGKQRSYSSAMNSKTNIGKPRIVEVVSRKIA